MCTLYPRYNTCCGIPVRIALMFIAILSIVTGAIINAMLKKAGVNVSSIQDVKMLKNLTSIKFQESNDTLLSSRRENEYIDIYQDVETSSWKSRRAQHEETTSNKQEFATIEILGEDGQIEVIRFLDDDLAGKNDDDGNELEGNLDPGIEDPPTMTTKRPRPVTRPPHTTKKLRHGTRSPHTTKKLRHGTRPSHTTKKLRHGTRPSHTTKKLRQRTRLTTESHRRTTSHDTDEDEPADATKDSPGVKGEEETTEAGDLTSEKPTSTTGSATHSQATESPDLTEEHTTEGSPEHASSGELTSTSGTTEESSSPDSSGELTSPAVSQSTATTTTELPKPKNETRKDKLFKAVGYVNRNGLNFLAMMFIALGILLLVANFLNSPDLALLYVVLLLATAVAALVLLVGVVSECTQYHSTCVLKDMDWFSAFMVTLFWFIYIFVWAFFAAIANSFANGGVGNTL